MATATLKSKPKSQKQEPLNNSSSGFSGYLKYIYPLLLILAFAKTYSYIYDEKLHMGGDNADYYLLGKALEKGEGYVNISNVDKSPAFHFPPGYPLIVAAVMKVFGHEITTIKTANGVFLIASLLLCFILFSKFTRNLHISFVASFLVMLNGTMLSFSTAMYSEVPFVFFTMLSLYFFLQIKDLNNFIKDPNFYLFVVTSVFSYYIRTIGISLFGGIMLYLIIRKHWKFLGVYAGSIIALALPWIIRNKMLGLGNTYLQQLVMVNPYQPEHGFANPLELLARLWRNLERYISKEIPAGVLNSVEVDYTVGTTAPWHLWVYGILALGIMIFGIYKLKEKRTLLVSYIIGNFGILLLWPDVYFGSRFMISMIPFFVLFICLGIKELLDQFVFQRFFKTNLNPLFLLIFSFLFIPKVKALHGEANGTFVPEVQNYLKSAIWAEENTPKDAVFCCRKPSLFALYSNRYVTSFLSTLDQEELIKDLEARKVDYVVLDALGYTSTSRYLYPAIQNNPLMFPIVKQESGPDTYVLKFNRETSYEGELKDGKKEGIGKVTYLMGHIYEGEFKSNKMHGQGKLIYNDKAVYEGGFSEGKRAGKGTYTWPQGPKYVGDWQNDMRHGMGAFTMTDGSAYIGEWKSDKRNGKGIYTWADNTQYEGMWKDDKRTGESWLIMPNGTAYLGIWNEDKLNGDVKVYDKNRKYVGMTKFKDNAPVK